MTVRSIAEANVKVSARYVTIMEQRGTVTCGPRHGLRRNVRDPHYVLTGQVTYNVKIM